MNTAHVINISTVPHRSPFRYPGGKTWLVPYTRLWLDSLPARPHQLSEPFAGGAIVGLSALFEGRCNRLSLVELDEDVAAVWQTILDGKARLLANRITQFDVSHETVARLLRRTPRGIADRAFATLVKNRVQRGGILAPGASLMKNGENGRGLLSRWYPQTLKNRILAIGEYRDNICFIHGDGVEYLREHAHLDNLVYFIDPPYTVAGSRLYAHSEINHERLFETAASLRGDFLMSYDNADPIRRLAMRFAFDTREVAMKSTHHSIKRELLIGRDLSWLRSPSELRQNPLFECG